MVRFKGRWSEIFGRKIPSEERESFIHRHISRSCFDFFLLFSGINCNPQVIRSIAKFLWLPDGPFYMYVCGKNCSLIHFVVRKSFLHEDLVPKKYTFIGETLLSHSNKIRSEIYKVAMQMGCFRCMCVENSIFKICFWVRSHSDMEILLRKINFFGDKFSSPSYQKRYF